MFSGRVTGYSNSATVACFPAALTEAVNLFPLVLVEECFRELEAMVCQ